MKVFFTLLSVLTFTALFAQTTDSLVTDEIRKPKFMDVSIRLESGEFDDGRTPEPARKQPSWQRSPYRNFNESYSKRGVKDKNGKVIIPPVYDIVTTLRLYPSSNYAPYFMVRKREANKYLTNILDTLGQPVFAKDQTSLYLLDNGKLLVTDEEADASRVIYYNGRPATDVTAEDFIGLIHKPLETMASDVMALKISLGYDAGLIDRQGNIIVPMSKRRITLEDSVIIVGPTGRDGFASQVLDYNLNELYTSRNHYVRYADHQLLHLVNRTTNEFSIQDYAGKVLFGPTKIKIEDQVAGFIVFTNKETELRGLMNQRGELLLTDQYRNIKLLVGSKLLEVTDTLRRTVLMDVTGRALTEWAYQTVKDYSSFGKEYGESYAVLIERDGKYQLYDAERGALLPEFVDDILKFNSLGPLIFVARKGFWFAYDLVKRQFVTEERFLTTTGHREDMPKSVRQKLPANAQLRGELYGYDTQGRACAIMKSGEVIRQLPGQIYVPGASLAASFEQFIREEKKRSREAITVAPVPKSELLRVSDVAGLEITKNHFNRGWKNREGEMVIPTNYLSVQPIIEGQRADDILHFIAVTLDREYNVINSALEPVFAENKGYIHHFAPDRLLVTDAAERNTIVTDLQGNQVATKREDFTAFRVDDQLPETKNWARAYDILSFDRWVQGMIDTSGRFVVPVAVHYIWTNKRDLLHVAPKPPYPALNRLLDTTFQEVWSGTESITELFPTSFLTWDYQRQQSSLLSYGGDTLWQSVSNVLEVTDDGFIYEQVGSKLTGFLDARANEILPPVFGKITLMAGTELLQLTDTLGRTTLADYSGKQLIDLNYQSFKAYRPRKVDGAMTPLFFTSSQAGKWQLHAADGAALLKRRVDGLVINKNRPEVFGVVTEGHYRVHRLSDGKKATRRSYRSLSPFHHTFGISLVGFEKSGRRLDDVALYGVDKKRNHWAVFADGTELLLDQRRMDKITPSAPPKHQPPTKAQKNPQQQSKGSAPQ